jgi:hypothetical protein
MNLFGWEICVCKFQPKVGKLGLGVSWYLQVRNMFMKKIVLGLALCLGLSQVVVAEKMETKGLPEDAKGAMAWIKANPKKAAAIATSIAALLVGGTYTGIKIYKHDGKDGYVAKFTGGMNDTWNSFTGLFKKAEAATTDEKATTDDAKETKSWISSHKKTTISIAVVAVIAAAVIAEFATDEDSKLKLSNLWNKLFKKASTDEVVASK